jgi:hypothetical protein
MGTIVEKDFKFQTPEAAQAVKDAHRDELRVLAEKYKMTPVELVRAAEDHEIDDQKDLFFILKRSYILSEN